MFKEAIEDQSKIQRLQVGSKIHSPAVSKSIEVGYMLVQSDLRGPVGV